MSTRIKLLLSLVVAIALVASPLAAKNWTFWGDSHDRSADVWLGIQSQSVDYEIAEAFDLDLPYGVIVNVVVADSPADEAGLEEGDVIHAINGTEVTDTYELDDALMNLKPGDEAVLTVNRDGRELTITTEVERRPNGSMRLRNDGGVVVVSPDGSSFTVTDNWSAVKRGYLGVSLQSLNDQLADYFGAADGGALISEVKEDSPADRAGLMAGDIIVGLAEDKVYEVDDVTKALGDFRKGDEVTVEVLRRGQTQSIQVELDETSSGRYFFNKFDPSTIDVQIPDIDIQVPELRMRSSFWTDDERREVRERVREELREAERDVQEEMKAANKELREAMRELKKEMEELRRKLE